ncbi:hypothetical protein DPMN_008688 [Dreissena polymorpha]|uniref:Uncharacterized protein n=1 Tax=Dreissena polymorpha TaxID=45954 RepID=A0A9D4RZX7_DREPO|nr:hypothetical protein DPMN_008688 [Dreissena polymorpha]
MKAFAGHLSLFKYSSVIAIFSAERVDNAKLLKGINYETGLCGTLTPSTVGQLLFRTCANILTIQFYTLDTQKGSVSTPTCL